MKLMLGIPTGEYARRAEFYDYYNSAEKPFGTVIMSPHGQSPAKSRNVIVEAAITNQCTHILFIDDDQAFGVESINKILAHADKDVVSGLYLMRNYPHYPVAFDEAHDGGECKHLFLTPEMSGLVEVVNCGFGFVLIQTRVFQALEKPWVRLGEIEKDGWCDDVGFFNRVRKAGFRIFCDLNIPIGHFINLTMWPRKVNGTWQTVYVTNTGQEFMFPQIISGGEPTGQMTGDRL
jgi:hypothetical protein